MPGKIKVKILAGRNLPVMDRSGDTTDAYVEIKFGTTTYKTDVCRKSLNPQWNSEWYKFEVEDSELQDEPLQIRLMDHDTYSANDAIGKVYINLNPLLLPGVPPPVKNIWTLEASMNSSTGSQGGSVMTGWLPVYDTMHGIRGEVNIIVKVELFLDFNKFRQSSCGVTFFYSSIVPHGYHAQVIHGFVEELVVSDDPEYKWIDKIRTPRASNEARQTLFLKLSNEVQRKIGLKALDLGGNAVIGYLQNFDLEGESGIVARGIGTVVTLIKLHDLPNFLSDPNNEELTSLGLKSNKPQSQDCSESEGSPHHHHHHDNYNSPPMSSSTFLGSKFPVHPEKVPVTPLKIVENAQTKLTRHSSVQSWSGPRTHVGSTLSLSDDLMNENSLRAMLALEDMRGEPQASRLTRGLRHLRYLPQSVLAKRQKIRGPDSLDDESDPESINSSTWSIGGSDSTRSTSIMDLQQIVRKKKFTHRKTSGEGMAAMLIRSVHAGGLPLDIVKEDRETPTPSPVNFLDEEPQLISESLPLMTDELKVESTLKDSEKSDNESTNNNKTLLVTYAKMKITEEEDVIPINSSSGSDSSSSEDEEDDEPSESSTNYNILDDTLSLLDPSSPEVENCPLLVDNSQFKLYPSTLPSFASHITSKEENENEEMIKSEFEDKEEERPIVPPLISNASKESTILVDDFMSSEFSSDIDSDLPVTYDRTKKSKKLSSPSRASKPVDQKKRKKVPEPLKLLDQSPSSENLSEEIAKSPTTPDKIPKNTGVKITRHRLHKQLSVIQTDEDDQSESSEDEYYIKKQVRPVPLKIQDKKLLINFEDDQPQSSSTDQRGKSPRKVERTDTVIYKGPKDGKNLLDSSNLDSPSVLPLSPVVVNNSTADNNNHLKVPTANLKDIIPKSPYPTEDSSNGTKSVFNFPDNAQVAEMMFKKYRQSSMHDLIKLIDSKMLAHHHAHNDSFRRRRHMMLSKRNQTPSPDSLHRKLPHYRRSRSRSPESSSGHHRHLPHASHPSTTSLHRLVKHSKNHHESSESIVDKTTHSNSIPKDLEEVVAKRLAKQPLNNHKNQDTECFEMHDLKHHDNKLTTTTSHTKQPAAIATTTTNTTTPTTITTPTTTIAATTITTSTTTTVPLTNSTTTSSPTTTTTTTTTTTSTTTTTMTNASEVITTNTANATDNLCVSQSPLTRRQQHNQKEENLQQGTSVSPGGNHVTAKTAHSPAAKNPGIPLHRRSSDSDLSITPKDKSFKKGRSFRLRRDRGYSSKSMLSDRSSGNSLTGSDRSMGGYLKPSSAIVRTMNQETLEMLEYPFITMQQYPPGFILHIGGLVSARSVKLLERITNLEEPEGRDSWWTEIRMEVRSHARALACNVVIGYREETSICDDVCVLSGSGTAAIINLHSTGQDQDNVLITHVQGPMTTSTDSDKVASGQLSTGTDKVSNQRTTSDGSSINQQSTKQRNASESNDHEPSYTGYSTSSCSICHLPYNKSSMNFQVNVSKCAVCRRAKVPDVMFTTMELPEQIPITGRGCFIQATVCKLKKDLRGELNAKEISDCLPFLEYDLHSLLLNKLRVRGMNAAFGLRVQVSVGERLVVGVAVGTAVYLTALPPPSLPQIANGNSWHNEEQLANMQRSLVETAKKNIEFYQLKPVPELENGRSMSDTDESEDELPELDLGLGMKDVCVLEVDDIEDIDRISLLMDERPPNDFHVVNTETIPGLEDLEIVRNLQMFTQVSRAKIPINQSGSMPSKYFARLLQTVYFKLRRMVPCALCDLQFKISMPEQDEIQLSVVGMALGLGEPTKYNKVRRRLLSHSISKDQVKRTDDSDMIFSLDEDHAENLNIGDPTGNAPNTPNTPNTPSMLNTVTSKPRPRSPMRMKHTAHRHKHVPLKERYGVDITPLSYLPGGRIDRYLGNLNFFFIRESNSIRENGGLSGFIHSFVTEVLAIVRAHVTALGGNAMVAFFMTQCVLLHSPHKNQGQCLINVGGDVVNVSYFGNDKHAQQQPIVEGKC